VPLLHLELPTFKTFNLTSSDANYLHSGAVAAPRASTFGRNVQLLVCACSFCHLGTDFAHIHDINGSCSLAPQVLFSSDFRGGALCWLFHHLKHQSIVNLVSSIP